MAIDVGEKKSVVGRPLSKLEKYGTGGTAYFGKVLMSSGEKPVLGRQILMDLPGGPVIKNLPANAGDAGEENSIPGSGRCSGGGTGNSL